MIPNTCAIIKLPQGFSFQNESLYLIMKAVLPFPGNDIPIALLHFYH